MAWTDLLPQPQAPTPNIGANPNALLQLQLNQLRLQEARQEVAGQNQLRQMFANPQNIGPNGQFQPTGDALSQLGQVDPNKAFEVQNSLALMRDRQQRNALVGAEVRQKYADQSIEEIAIPSAKIHDDAIAAGKSEEEATRLATEFRKDKWKEFSSNLPDDMRKQGESNLTYNDQAVKAAIVGSPKGQAWLKQNTDSEVRTDYGKNPPVEYRVFKNGRMTDITGKSPYTPSGVGEPKGPETKLFVGRDDQGNDVRYRYTPGGTVDESGKPVDATKLKGVHQVGTKAEGGSLHPSKEIAVVDKEGNVVDRFAARERSDGPGWVRADTGQEVTVPQGGKIDVGQAAGAVIGSRENVYIGRILEGGITATTDLENISKMPISVSSGVFGGRKQGPGLLDATKEVLANQLTSQDVQIYNSANTGIQRALAIIESSGLAPSGAFTEQFQGLTLKEGDTQMARLYKLANARQIVENGMEVIKANPRVAPEQKKLADRFVQRVQTSIPWTTSDVIRLQTAEDPNATLHNLGAAKTGKGEQTSAQPSPPVSRETSPSAGQQKAQSMGLPFAQSPSDVQEMVKAGKLKQDDKFVDPDGVIRRVP